VKAHSAWLLYRALWPSGLLVTNLFRQALATDGSGNLYIADGNSNNISELPAGGSTAQNVTSGGFTLLAGGSEEASQFVNLTAAP
jgi:hypothetical protein